MMYWVVYAFFVSVEVVADIFIVWYVCVFHSANLSLMTDYKCDDICSTLSQGCIQNS